MSFWGWYASAASEPENATHILASISFVRLRDLSGLSWFCSPLFDREDSL
jgi:hypothetical protein